MQTCFAIPSSARALLASGAALLATTAGCRSHEPAEPAPERVVYVNAPAAPPAPPPNPQTMVENPNATPHAVNTAIPVQQLPPAPNASGAPAPAPSNAPPQPVERYVVSEAPPPQVVETIVPSPGPTYVWVGGRWVWRDRWVWAPGYWAPRPWNRAVWVEGHWAHRHHEWVWVNGHWR
jgi:hypothetical protein